MITLPRRITTTMLQSFWIVFWILSTTVLTLIAYMTLNSPFTLFLLLLLPVIVLPGYKNPDIVVSFYTLFNRVLRLVRRIICKMFLYIIHFLFLISFRVSGDNLRSVFHTPPKKSMWVDKEIINLAGEGEDHDVSIDNSTGSTWIRPLLHWIIHTKKWWLLTLMPFLYIASLISENKDVKSIAHDTYTLY